MPLFAATSAAAAFCSILHGGVSPIITVHVEIKGTVEFNAFASGALAGVPANAPASIRFDVTTDNWVNSPTYPVRGYRIETGTFRFNAGSATVPLTLPVPGGATPFFVIRDNDPAVDGFVLSTNVDIPVGLPVNTGVTNCTLDFLRTFDVGTVFPSRNILSILGYYGFEQMSSFDWSINRGPGTPMGMIYESIRLWRACAADVASLGGAPTPDAQMTADDVVVYLAGFFSGNKPIADVATLGGGEGPDGQLTADDLIVFLGSFFAGCQ